MYLHRLWLNDFRSYEVLEVELDSGRVAVLGDNGVGKSNLIEAVAYLATLESFRGSPTDAMIRAGADTAVVRGALIDVDGREQLIEAELTRTGRNRVLVNRQRLQRARDLLGTVRVTVFAPDDLELIKGGPALRRNYLDQLLVAMHPRNDATRAEVDKALRQRNALLKQVRGRLDDSAAVTLEVWDTKLAAAGDRLGELRAELIRELEPMVATAYADVAGRACDVAVQLVAPWREHGLRAALDARRDEELRRGITLVGPHRDDVHIELSAMPTRTQSSQGEQRSMALALRLAAHRLVHRATGVTPLLLLDDVFSELDPTRSAALLDSLPTGQTLLSSAVALPEGIEVEQVLDVAPGAVRTR